MTVLLDVRHLCSGYGRLPVLFDVDFHVEAGEMLALVGSNGAGKSTLLKTILGLVPATRGDIVYAGRRIVHEPPYVRFTRGISLCPEGRRIFKNLTVTENLTAGSYRVQPGTLARQKERCFGLFPRLEERQRQRAGTLSGGEQQMLAISRALMSDPQLLLVDELSMGLAPLVVAALLDALSELCHQGLAVVIVDQLTSRLLERAHRACVMEKGHIVTHGSPHEAASHAETAGLGYDPTLLRSEVQR